jgi:hypothetical protein
MNKGQRTACIAEDGTWRGERGVFLAEGIEDGPRNGRPALLSSNSCHTCSIGRAPSLQGLDVTQ